MFQSDMQVGASCFLTPVVLTPGHLDKFSQDGTGDLTVSGRQGPLQVANRFPHVVGCVGSVLLRGQRRGYQYYT